MTKTVRRRRRGWLRLALAGCLFLLAIWVLLPAQNRTTFYLSLLVTEFGWLMAPVGCLWLWRFRRFRFGISALILSLMASALLFAPPVMLMAQSQWFSFQKLVYQPLPEAIFKEHTRDLIYANHGFTHERYTVDGAFHTVILIHGGGWRSGKPDMLNHWRDWWLSQGFNVVMANHRKAPEHHYPAQLDDIDELVLSVSKLSAKHKLIIQGHSSGGHLALLAAYQAPLLIDAVIAFYPPTDLLQGYDDKQSSILDVQQVLKQFMGKTPSDNKAIYMQASPVHHVTKAVPPTLLLHGSRDDWVDVKQARAMTNTLRRKQAAYDYHELPFANHAFDFSLHGLHGRYAQAAIENFIHQHLAEDLNKNASD